MKHFLFLILVFVSTGFSQELGLDGDTVSSPKNLEDQLKQIGMEDLLVEESVPAKKSSSIQQNGEMKKDATTPASVVTGPQVVPATNANPVVTKPVPPVIAPVDVTPKDSSAQTVVVKDSSADIISSAGVKSVSTVDIQGSLEDYRSPLKAMFFSLAIPGTGQLYTKKYWKSGIFVAAEIAAIVGAVKFNRTGDRIRDDAHQLADKQFSTERLGLFYNELTQYGAGKIDTIDSYLFANLYVATAKKSAVDLFVESIESDLYGNAGRADVSQGWSDATPEYNPNASGNTPFYDVVGTSYEIDPMGIKLVGEKPYGSSVYQDKYSELLTQSEKRYSWGQTMVVALIVNHIASAADAFITAHRYNRSKMNEKIESAPVVSLQNNLYRSEAGALVTGLDVVWKF